MPKGRTQADPEDRFAMGKLRTALIFGAIAILGAIALAVIALHQGESISAVWIVVAALCVYAIAYRFYARYLAGKVMGLNAKRPTPAVRHNDGLDYVPTPRNVLFGHHFAAIAGAGPLVGPVLAAQMGYLPGVLWILVGAVLAGAVQDMMVLFMSTRRDGRSLGDMVRTEMGPIPGIIAQVGVLMIMVIILAVLALVVVKALAESPWGTFTVAATIPIAIFMGLYTRYLRPGRVGEVSLIGVVLLILAIIGGGHIAADPFWGPAFTLSGTTLAIAMMAYGFVASVIPVWLLLAPRDYLSTFLKIGAILGLAVGILIVRPHIQMPAITPFIDGSGPVFSGALFPFLFITIACGAVSGFHALISSGTTPKLLENENQIPLIGYGAMLCESFVAIMALIAATVLDPAVYFAMNSPVAVIGDNAVSAAAAVAQWGFHITPAELEQLARDVGEHSILSRAGGAPTLAVGMAHILSNVIGGKAMMAFWYHFAILFEALFILTTVDAGTRVCRFMIQDLLGVAVPKMRETKSWTANVLATALTVGLWGYFLYTGVVDPLGGINSLWPLFGIANQMLAAVALILGTVVLFKMKRERFAWATAVPAVWLLICTLTAGFQKLLHPDVKIGFLAHARKYQDALTAGDLLAPAKTAGDMHRIIINDYVNSALTAGFLFVVLTMVVYGVRACLKARRINHPTVVEQPAAHELTLEDEAMDIARA
ncbi:carbon starvation protein [Brevundimonas bullata]|uniref:Carbon starvation protein n=1 Tax=Brevundimonas bullata TaxID=13160 RepID=A0A7W7N4M5_9CAUL|nr:carbon starvation CstA family protein [Brevundimonas bullata]MBB4798556.1 carbon starvation protein [Brevundimonas bullata]MBB6383129.1 carbon starvation protein [Brevundimonas bullata]